MFIKIHNSVIKGDYPFRLAASRQATFPKGTALGTAGNFFAAAETFTLRGKVAKPQALTEGVSYYNMYYFSPLFQPFAQF